MTVERTALEYVVADAFTDTPLQGNPVAVFLDGSSLSSARMQAVAREMNLSETTFVLPARSDADATVRIFTPVNELPFAGHPLLGTAVVLADCLPMDRLNLETAMGVVRFTFERSNGRIALARMLQPIPTWEAYAQAAELLGALGVSRSELPVEVYRNGPRHVFVTLDDQDTLAKLNPDHRALASLPDMAANCIAGSGSDWTLRMFSPAYGVVEDAATGSAAGALAVHLVRHGLTSFEQEVRIRQGLQIGRPSTMYARARGERDRIDAVEVSGAAMIVARGTLFC